MNEIGVSKMYKAVSIDRSLFFIDQSFVEKFHSLALALEQHYELNMYGAISNDDVWTTAFNIWLLAQPDEMLVLESVEKTFYYSSNFIIYEHLKNDYYFNALRTNESTTPELTFLVSIHLTNSMNLYLYELMIQNGLQDIVEKNRHRNYFDAHNDTSLAASDFINDQARFVKVLVNDLKKTQTFSRIIKESYDKATYQYNQLIEKNELSVQS